MTAPVALAATGDSPTTEDPTTEAVEPDDAATEEGDAAAPPEEAAEETEQPADDSAEETEQSTEDPAEETEQSTETSAEETEQSTEGSEVPGRDDDSGAEASASSTAQTADEDVQLLAASPEYEIEGEWLEQPNVMSRGEPVVAEWRVNINDANEPPSNDPVDDVTATFSLEKAIFDEIPDICLTEQVTTPSSISADGTSLTCNFGTVNMGTALVVQTAVVATGVTGEHVAMVGTSPGGEDYALPRIPIENSFDMDLQLGQNSRAYYWDVPDYTEVDADVQWSLRLGKGSDPGPDSVQYRLTVTEQYGSVVTVGTHATQPEVGCTPFDYGNNDDHPWSRSDIAASHPRNTSFVDTCTLEPVPGAPGEFLLTLQGINYDLLNTPDSSSNGTTLPTDWNYIASGSLWFHAETNRSGSFTVDVDPVTYTSTGPIEQTSDDLVGNNTTNKTFFTPGSGHASWHRAYTGSGGNRNDNTYEVSAGTSVRQYVNNNGFNTDPPPTTQWGNCLALDTEYVTLADATPFSAVEVVGIQLGGTSNVVSPLPTGMRLEYYVGNDASVTPGSGQYDPNAFVCDGATGWTDSPASLADAKAVRIVYPHSAFDDAGADVFQLRAHTDINASVDVGQDVWMFGSINRGAAWIGPDGGAAATTPDSRYANTTNMRDVVRIIAAQPYIEKAAARSTVTAGVPADFTLTYSANGSGIIPDEVDGYEIVDTLPAKMAYVPGSAMCGPQDAAVACEPVVSVDLQGRQVLTWTLDGVATNEPHELRYQAVADSDVEPGTQLTNTAVSSYAGESSRPVTATVTTTNNGYTTILKTADVEFIPNQNGDGVGTGSWTVQIDSVDPQSQDFTDTIDILPYVGDQRGTSFSGSYTLDEVVLNNGGTVYYTDAPPETLSDDPDDPANGAANAPSAMWMPLVDPANPPADVTAIRVIGGELVSGGSFSFRVVITTDGAQPQDVYVNRAQARAEHTELVMRTSASLVVTDYVVEKSSNPESGSTVEPGDTITYTVLVTQQGPVPAGAWFTDTLTDVFDDAVYNGDVSADIGTVALNDDVLEWEGVIPVGEVATITYSVTVKDVPGLQEEGNTFVNNVVESPGCQMPENCTTEHLVGYFEYSKTSEAAPGSTVQVGEVITYTVLVEQRGEGAVAGASIEDDLTAVLDDADWNDDIAVNSGTASFAEPTLSWTGDLAVGDVVELTYSVTVTEAGVGDDELMNVVTTDDHRGACIPARDENPDCTTSHQVGDYQVMKTSDPVSGSAVEVGDVIEYTVTVNHVGIAAVAQATLSDDLSAVLDDATWNDDLAATAGAASFEEPTLTWAGPLAVDEQVTLTYSVTVSAEGDRHLVNVVTTGGQCVPAEGQDEACTTEHINGAYVYSKTSDPESGSQVGAGDVVTYTVVVEHVGTAAVEDAIVVDDLSGVLDVADWNGDADASSGAVNRSGDELTWTGDLDIAQVVTITYSVTVGDQHEATMENVVTSPDERGVCVPAADGNPDCMTVHYTAPPLPTTGVDGMTMLTIGGGVLTLMGAALLLGLARRREQQETALIA